MYLRYSLRTATYVGFLREEYPPFTFVTTAPDPGDDPRVSVDLVPALEKSAGDVAAHVVGGMTDIVAGRLEGLGHRR